MYIFSFVTERLLVEFFPSHAISLVMLLPLGPPSDLFYQDMNVNVEDQGAIFLS